MADYYEEFITGRPGVVLAVDEDGNPVAIGHDGSPESIAAADARLNTENANDPPEAGRCACETQREAGPAKS